MTDSSHRPIVLEEHDPAWSGEFLGIRTILRQALGLLCLAVEHVGSTAVPDLAAKPILDVDVVIPSEEDLPAAIRALCRLGYVHQGDLGIPGREAFHREDERVPRDGSDRRWMSHHLYVCARDAVELRRHLLFRDHLRGSPGDRAAYAALKRELAARHTGDRDAYCAGKSSFVEAVLQRAAGPPQSNLPWEGT